MEQTTIFDMMYPKYKIAKPIRLIELFAGYGSQALALKYLDVPFEHWRTCEWAVKSIQAYKDIHFTDKKTRNNYIGVSKETLVEMLYEKGISSNYNEPMTREQIERLSYEQLTNILDNIMITNNLVNIQQVKGKDLEIVDTDKYDYIMTYSFPCFTKDSLVLTDNGYKNINKIKVGDKVITHKNHYEKVTNTFDNGIHDIYKINAMGVDEIKTTANHKFYVREMYRKGHTPKRYFKEPKWKETIFLNKKDYLGIPINKYSKIPNYNNLPTNKELFWWVVGRYFGDGWYKTKNAIIICCAKNELEEITRKLDNIFKYKVYEDKSTYKVYITLTNLGEFVLMFGKGAINKHLNNIVTDLPVNLLEEFLKGYFSADGCKVGKIYKATTISRELAYGIGMCIAKVYKMPYKIYKCIRPKKYIIEGREVNQHNTYQIVFKKEKCKQDKAFYEDNYIWYPIKEISYIGKENVYDIEVENDHSFTIQNTIVHNCQDLSLAGKGKGMSDTSTRSGMLWEVERILTECKELGTMPQVLLMENVPQVHSLDNMPDFHKWQVRLEELGYKSYWQDLIATDYGIPQTRNRCFMVSILGDYSYTFPQPKSLKLKLKDMLEDNVDEKYYLSDKMINYCLGVNQKESKFPRGERFLQSLKTTNEKGIANTINTNAGNRPVDNFITEKEYIGTYDYAQSNTLRPTNESRTHIDSEVSGALLASGNHNGILIKNATKQGYLIAEDGDGVDISTRMEYHRGTVQKGKTQTLTTMGGENNGVVVADTLKRDLCNKLIQDGLVEEGDVVKHSYTQQIMDGNKKCVEKNDGNMITLTTRGDCVGVCVTEKPQVIGGFGKIGSTGQFHQQNRVYDDNVAISVTTAFNPFYKDNLRIRKLTPRECFRLMGVKDEDFDKVRKSQSDASLYHLAGDSIVVNVLMAIFKELL